MHEHTDIWKYKVVSRSAKAFGILWEQDWNQLVRHHWRKAMGTEKTCLSSLSFSGDINILEDWLQNNAKYVGVKLNLENES